MIPKTRNTEAATHNRHPQAELPPFPVPRLPRLRRQRAAQGELTPELIRTAQGWWDWVLGHREFPQSARGAAAMVVMAAAAVVPVLQAVALATVGCGGGSKCDGGKVWWW